MIRGGNKMEVLCYVKENSKWEMTLSFVLKAAFLYI